MLLLPLSVLLLLTQPWRSLGAEMMVHSQKTLANGCTLVVCSPPENGLPGRDGKDGREGPRGEKGDPGSPGPAGRAGRPGPAGPTGPKGDSGSAGEPGPKGDTGPPGPPGIRGPAGREGPSGRQGSMGPPGTPGPKGEPGPKGGVGAPGMQGSPGLKGERGAPGEIGAPGRAGAAGPAGAIGPQGPSGARGPPGLKGDRGTPGERGEKGESGLAEVNALRQRVTILEGHLRRFQNAFSQYKKAVLFPDGQAVREKIFKTAGVVKSYSDAQQLCTEAKGQLASPRSAAENEAVTQLARAHKENAYLSMNDISTEGRFTYPSGEILVYSNWASGEPNNSNDGQPEHCVEIYPEGKWNDIPCSEQRLVICEF
ncbi:PREDICTED: collectin-46 [Capra hircus]|uniref:Collectin-46 n=1 Tax=Capra hircus TaxID=9925 RepID=A0A452FFU9_CAPHI|nr:collectin-46 precursor [Capra hircus]